MDLEQQRADALAAAEAIENRAAADSRGFTDDERAEHAKLVAQAKALADDIRTRAAAEAERNAILPTLKGAATAQDGSDPQASGNGNPAAGSLSTSLRDPGHYRPNGSQHAYFGDLLAVQQRQDANGAALDRLRATSEFERSNPQNVWKADTDQGGQEFMPPGYLQDLFYERAVGQSVLGQLVNVLPLPDGIRTVTIPRMTGDATVDEHTEDAAVTPATPTTDDATASVYHLVGVVDASLFLRDRSNPNIDRILMRHFAKLQALKIDTRIANGSGTGQAKGVLNVSGTNSATISTDGDLSSCYPKLADIISQIEDGHYNSPTAIAVAARRFGAWAAELDSTGRPLMVPAAVGAQNPTAGAEGNPTPVAAGFTGYQIMGVPLYKVPAIPKTLGGTTNADAILACDWEEFYLWLGAIMFDVSEHVDFKKAGVSFRSRQYYAFLADHAPEAIGKVTGGGLQPPTF